MNYIFSAGSNGPDSVDRLRFAESDAERVAAAFSHARCGYTRLLAERPASASSVRTSFERACSMCKRGDTLIAYFACHGTIENGELVMLWDDTDFDNIVGTTTWSSDLVRALSYCQASSKLVILDCCKAGGVVRDPGFRDADDREAPELRRLVGSRHRECLFLVASDHIQRARELESLGGGFLAAKLIEAITDAFHRIPKRCAAELGVDDFKDWVRSEARIHNASHPAHEVPLPFVFGRSEEGVVLRSNRNAPITELEWPNSHAMIILPHRPIQNEYALLIAKHPTTNRQYREAMTRWGARAPYGEEFHENAVPPWQGPFYPLLDERFNDDAQPVVCVSHRMALHYCQAIEHLLAERFQHPHPGYCRLPNAAHWVFAALGNMYARKAIVDPAAFIHEVTCGVHHQSRAPVRIEDDGSRTNPRGVSDMIGNVWEWIGDQDIAMAVLAARGSPDETVAAVGGGYLDDVRNCRLRVSGLELPNGGRTCHADLGFRIAGLAPIESLSRDTREYLHECVHVDDIEQPLREWLWG